MVILFEIKNIKQQWQPPFQKSIEAEEARVSAGGKFGKLERFGRHSVDLDGFAFTLVEVNSDHVVVEYDHELTVKDYRIPKDRRVSLKKNETKSFSYLWGEDGATKKITYKGQI